MSSGGKRPGAGRKKGSIGRATIALALRKDPMVILADTRTKQILQDRLPCSVCKGRGKTRWQPANGKDKFVERTCQSCWGSRLEKLSPELVAKVALDVREYGYPKRKAIEVTGENGGPVQHAVVMEIVRSGTAQNQD